MNKIEDYLDLPIWQLTGRQFLELLNDQFPNKKEFKNENISKGEEQYIGLEGLAKLLKCSKRTAHNIKKTGYIDTALTKAGKSIAINPTLCLELYKENEIKIHQKLRKLRELKYKK